MALKLPRLPRDVRIVDERGYPTVGFQIWWQTFADKIEEAFNALADNVAAIADAQAAADNANAAAAAANTAANNAQNTADAITETSELATSYVTGLTLSATDAGSNATITISAHTRHYPQPNGTTTNVAVNSGSLTALAYDTLYYIYYDDASRAGGAVTYQSTTSEGTAAQIGNRHTVGAIRTPVAAAANTGGVYPTAPGIPNYKFNFE